MLHYSSESRGCAWQICHVAPDANLEIDKADSNHTLGFWRRLPQLLRADLLLTRGNLRQLRMFYLNVRQ